MTQPTCLLEVFFLEPAVEQLTLTLHNLKMKFSPLTLTVILADENIILISDMNKLILDFELLFLVFL